jgi:hypothetical protein
MNINKYLLSIFLQENFDIILGDSIEFLDYKSDKEISNFLLSNYGGTLYHINLTSLEGSPREIYGDFDCSDNLLTSLKGGPQEIDGDFDCSYNDLTSLEGGPKEVGGYFDCSGNKLTSLKGSPEKVEGYFWCKYNELTSLEGAPWQIDGLFDCRGNFKLPKYKIDAYNAYLDLFDSEKIPLTKNWHYFPTEEWEQKFR